MKAALLAFLLAGTSASAATTDDIFASYARGDYEQAAKAGEAAHTATGLAIAARAVLAEDVLRDQPCLSCLERAESLARRAVALDPHNPFGQLWLAVSLGYQARITGIVRARLHDTPAQSKMALDAAIAADPRNAYAVSALGGWHIEIVKGGGAYMARLLYGAREDEALALFDRAVKLAPDNVAVRYQIALALLGFDTDKYRARTILELKTATVAHADTAYEKKMQGRADELLALLTAGDHDGLVMRVRKYQGYP